MKHLDRTLQWLTLAMAVALLAANMRGCADHTTPPAPSCAPAATDKGIWL